MDGNLLFHTFNHLVFGDQLTVEETKLKIWDFILRNRGINQNIWEGNLETRFQNMAKNWVWEQI